MTCGVVVVDGGGQHQFKPYATVLIKCIYRKCDAAAFCACLRRIIHTRIFKGLFNEANDLSRGGVVISEHRQLGGDRMWQRVERADLVER